MPRKVIIDCDPGIDDAVALGLALFDPRLEVLAVTACAGTVDADKATENVVSLIERFDPPRIPRIGAAIDPESDAAVSNNTLLHGEDGLGNTDFSPVSRQHSLPSDKLIEKELRANPGEVTLVCTGPLTGVAKAFSRDAGLAEIVDRVVIAGGSIGLKGDETATAEFNMHFDPKSARQVIHSATTKSLIPLEVTEAMQFGLDLVDKLPPGYSKVGGVLEKIVPHLFRSTRQHLGRETVSLQAVMPILMLVEPMLAQWTTMACDIEVAGELTRGATVFDRREPRQWRANVEVGSNLDVEAARDAFFNCLKYAAQVL
ncbi:MAG: nucleoside hydrolase [Planctomycetota bacterium]